MTDLTVLYYTAGSIPDSFATKIRDTLHDTVREHFPIISITAKPLNFGANICVGDREEPNVLQIYRNVLLGAKLAKTEYVACCEDKNIYPLEHFTEYRSPGKFSYDMNRYMIFAWEKEPIYSKKTNRYVLHQLIAPRELLIEALEERFAKTFTEERIKKHFAEPGRYERWLGVTIREKDSFEATQPSIVINHGYSLSFKNGLGKRKRHGDIRELKLDTWGSAKDVLLKYLGEDEWKKQIYL